MKTIQIVRPEDLITGEYSKENIQAKQLNECISFLNDAIINRRFHFPSNDKVKLIQIDNLQLDNKKEIADKVVAMFKCCGWDIGYGFIYSGSPYYGFIIKNFPA